MPVDEPPRLREALPVSAVAGALGLSPSRVRQLLDDDGCPLAGPPGGGRGSVRRVWLDTLAPYGAWTWPRTATKRPRAGEGGGDEERLTAVERRVGALEDASVTQLAQILFALAKSDAAADALRDALSASHEANLLRLRAAEKDAEALAAALRAERARDAAAPSHQLSGHRREG